MYDLSRMLDESRSFEVSSDYRVYTAMPIVS